MKLRYLAIIQKIVPNKLLRVKKSQTEEDKKELPIIQKGGNIIIQHWNTKNEIPIDVDNINLPIIFSRNKVYSLADAEADKKNYELLYLFLI